jgi:hypothetical protein
MSSQGPDELKVQIDFVIDGLFKAEESVQEMMVNPEYANHQNL